jgi:hypothetical protein
LLIVLRRPTPPAGAATAILDTDRVGTEDIADLEQVIRAAPVEDAAESSGESVASIMVFDGVRRWQLSREGAAGSQHEELVARISQLIGGRSLTACDALSVLSGLIAAQLAAGQSRLLINRLAEQAAGIRAGLLGIGDLIRGGSNYLPGTGLLSDYDDGSSGQVRHFCGIAASTVRLGASLTLLLSEHVRGDVAGTADDHLTRKAVEFTGLVLSGRLPLPEAGGWISRNICAARPLENRR